MLVAAMRGWIAIALLLTLLAGCTPARQIAAGQVRADTAENRDRLQRVGGALARANVEFCRDSVVGTMTDPASGLEVCALSILMAGGKGVDAATDGMNIILSQPLMAFVQSDDELAIVIGHELGHVLRKHLQERKALGAAAHVVGIFLLVGPVFQHVAERAFSPDREREADRWGAFMAARAGYRADAALEFWSRMPVDKGGFLPTHPSTPDRMAALRCVTAEIAFRQGSGLPLDPGGELKADQWRCAAATG